MDDLLQEGGEPFRYPGLGPVQGPDHDPEPGVTDLVRNLDEETSVSSQETGREEEEVRGGQAEATEAPVHHHHV